ncbi:MAG: hypothetical protein RL518_784 [Pseudomonadota bacterium]
MITPTFRALTLGMIAGASSAGNATAQNIFQEVLPPPRLASNSPEPNQQTLETLLPLTRPLLIPTDSASGPIAYFGPDRLQSKLTTFANHALAEVAQGWCDIPIEIPVTPLHVTLLKEGASGQATMTFDRGKMSSASVVANADEARMFGVIKHEMTHIVIRARCGLNLPRWFDEGTASLAEGEETLENFRRSLVTNYLVNGRGISFQALLTMTEPPTGDVTVPFYAQATTLLKFLREQAPGTTLTEKQHYLIRFILSVMHDGASMEAYQSNVRAYFGYPKVSALQSAWLEWLARER